MENQNTPATLKEKAQVFLEAAEEENMRNTQAAIDLLIKAEQLLPNMLPDDSKDSERNLTLGTRRGAEKILYLSKRGNILYEFKDYPEATACYKAIKDILPNNPQVYKAYGDCFRKQTKYDEALRQYEEGLRIDEILDSPAPAVTAGLLNSKGLAYLGLKKYQEALKDFKAAIEIRKKNPLYYCNSGHAAYALGKEDEALKYFKQASELVDSDQSGHLTKHNITYIQEKIQQFIQEQEDLEKIPLPRVDSLIDIREQKFVEDGIEALSVPKRASEGAAEGAAIAISTVMNQGNQLRETKQKLRLIQEDPILNEYYDGFMFTLAQSYATAVIVDKGQLVINTSITALDLLIKAISLLPLVGNQLSTAGKSLKDIIKSAEVRKAASQVCSFATTQSDFDTIAQDALCEVILEKKDELKSLNDTELNDLHLPSWASRFKKIIDEIKKVGSHVDQYLYGARNTTPLQKFGYQTATSLVSDHIASGEIYEGVPAVKISIPDKTTKLTNIVRKVIDQSFPHPLLHQIEAFTRFSDQLGPKRVLEVIQQLNQQIKQNKKGEVLLSSEYLNLMNSLLREQK